MPVSLDPVFEQVFSEGLPGKSAAMARAAADGTQPPPTHIGPAESAPSPLDIEAVARSFDTELAAEVYRLASSGESAEVGPSWANRMLGKLQADAVSRYERGVKSAGVTRVRSMALEASRRSRDSAAGGGYVSGIVAQVQALQELKST